MGLGNRHQILIKMTILDFVFLPAEGGWIPHLCTHRLILHPTIIPTIVMVGSTSMLHLCMYSGLQFVHVHY